MISQSPVSKRYGNVYIFSLTLELHHLIKSVFFNYQDELVALFKNNLNVSQKKRKKKKFKYCSGCMILAFYIVMRCDDEYDNFREYYRLCRTFIKKNPINIIEKLTIIPI